MSTATLAIIIVLCTCILYMLELFPVSVTTMIGMLAMVYSGVLTPAQAFSGFTNTAVLLVIGMVIIIDALLDCGLANRIGQLLNHYIGGNEKVFVVVIFLTASFLSMFMTNVSLVAMMMPLISSIAVASGGRITRKNTYLPLAMGGLIGGTGTLAGSTAPLLANNALEQVGAKTMSFFTPLPVAFAIVAVVSVCYLLFLYKFQVRFFDFPETEGSEKEAIKDKSINHRNAVITVTVFLICVVLFIIQPFGWELGQIAVTGALVLVLTKCVDGKKALREMHWSAIITLGSALGIATGFVNSGVGELIIHKMIETMGESAANPVLLMTVFLVAGYVLSLFMSNGSLVAMLASIAVPMAVEIGANPMPMALACVYGVSLAMATPAATTTITMVQVAGYRFKDYFRVGGLVGIIGMITAWVTLVVVYRMI